MKRRIFMCCCLLFTLGSVSSFSFAMQKKNKVGKIDCVVLEKDKEYIGDNVIEGQVIILDRGSICIGTNSTLTLKNVKIVFCGSNSVLLQDDSSTLKLDNVTWILEKDYNFNCGKFVVEGGAFHVKAMVGRFFSGPLKIDDLLPGIEFVYSSSERSVVKDGAKFKISRVLFVYSSKNGSKNVSLEGDRSILWLWNASLCNKSEMLFNEGRIKLDGYIFFVGTTKDTKIKCDKMIIFSGKEGCIFGNISSLSLSKCIFKIGREGSKMEFVNKKQALKEMEKNLPKKLK